MLFNHSRQTRSIFKLSHLCLFSALVWVSFTSSSWAQDTAATTSSASNTSSGHIGVFDGGTNAINGNVSGSNIVGTNVGVTTGANTNQNTNQTLVSSPAQAVGGSSALVLPRNPLMLSNANLGRSNFGLQFGLNNNPVFGSIFGKGAGNALGWFMQGGVTIPFGKIPDIIAHPQNNQMDNQRLQRLDDDRQVFGALTPAARSTVEGRVIMNAYSPSTVALPKVGSMQDTLKAVEVKAEGITPKVIAWSDSPIFTRPLEKAPKIGMTITGDEYRYVGHTSSGWLKLILPDGRQGWSKGQFEHLKNDFTQIDEITARNNTLDGVRQALEVKQSNRLLTLNAQNNKAHNH